MAIDPENLSFEDKEKIANLAFVICKEQISELTEFTPERAVDLGGRFVSYMRDSILFTYDFAPKLNWEGREACLDFVMRETKKDGDRADVVLCYLQTGKSGPLGDYLRETAGLGFYGLTHGDDDIRKFGSQLRKLADSLPEDSIGLRFSVPQLPWEDQDILSRFNTDLGKFKNPEV